MTRSSETLERIEPKVGALYDALKYTEDNKFARFFPAWFMLKRYIFVAMVFNFSWTYAMMIFSIHLVMVDFLLVLLWMPYQEALENRMEMFNLGFAYFFFMVI